LVQEFPAPVVQRYAKVRCSLLVAFLSVVAILCVLVLPARALASTTAGLTIVVGDKSSYTVLANADYTLSDGATVLQLLEAAQSKGDIKSFTTYELGSSTYPESIVAAAGTCYETGVTTTNGYWETSIAGESSSYFTLDDTVISGTGYQLRWVADYTTDTGIDWSEVSLTAGTDDTSTVDYMTTGDSTDEASYETLLTGITAHSKGTSDPWLALSLSAHGSLSEVDQTTLLSNALDVFNDPSSSNTSIEKYIIALTACGIDATQVPDGSTTLDAIALLADRSLSTVNDLSFALIAYDSGSYAVPTGATMDRSQIIEALLACQLSDGGFTYYGTASDSNMTAIVMSALAPYYTASSASAAGISTSLYAQVNTVISDCITVLETLQADDGGFVYNEEYASSGSDACSTAIVIVGLCSVGIDPQTDSRFIKETSTVLSTTGISSGISPLEALVACANSDDTGFTYYGDANDLATEQGYRALVAYEGYLANGGAYDIYTSAYHVNAGPDDTATTTSSTASSDAIPQTGDQGALVLALIVLVAGGALLGVGLARRAKEPR
jgi:LPXTG-motif cell wall-anchored protein